MTLFGDEDAALEKPRGKKAPAETDGAVKRLIDRFYAASVRRWNPPELVRQWEADPSSVPKRQLVTPLVHGGKHGTQMKRLNASWGEEAVADVIDRFFETSDPQITRTDYSFEAFFRLAQHLRLQPARRRLPDQRTSENLDAAMRAAGKRR